MQPKQQLLHLGAVLVLAHPGVDLPTQAAAPVMGVHLARVPVLGDFNLS
jgi:hypothetical protein